MKYNTITKFSKLPEESIEKIIILRSQGYGCKRLAKEFNVSSTTTKKWLKELADRDPLYKREIQCEECFKVVKLTHSNTKFCSGSCRNKNRKRTKTIKQRCQFCNEEFERHARQKFCTFKCSTEKKKQDRINRERKESKKRKSIVRQCQHCKADFYSHARNKVYCTKNCSVYAYKKRHKDKIANNVQRRRNKAKGLEHSLTDIQWDFIIREFSGGCAYCGEKSDLERDHFIPISKSGEFTINNIIPSCKKCNISKRDYDFFEWYPRHEYYSKKRERKILNHLGYKNNIQQLSIL